METGQSRRILLTGGTGFIGANLVHRLVAEGDQVSLLTRQCSNRTRLRCLEHRIQVIEADILDPGAVQYAVDQIEPEVVYHLASTPFNPPTIGAQTHMEVIAMGTLNLVNAVVSRPGVRVIYTGSAAEYGSGSRLREDSPLMPGTVVGAAKATASILMQTYARLHQVETVVLRLFTPYGPWERPGRLIPHTILSALSEQDVRLSSGQQQRDYVYVDDVIEALLVAATKTVSAGDTFNICSGQGTPIREVVERALGLMGNPVKALVGALPTRPDEIWESSGDNAAAWRILGWQPRTSLEDGLRKAIAWFTEHRELASSLV